MEVKVEILRSLILKMSESFSGFIPFEEKSDTESKQLKEIERERIRTFNPFKKKNLELKGWKLAYEKLEKLIREERKLNEYFIYKLLAQIEKGNPVVDIEDQYFRYLEAKYIASI